MRSVDRPQLGAPGRVRTCDLRVRNPSLYPTELQARKLVDHTDAVALYACRRPMQAGIKLVEPRRIELRSVVRHFKTCYMLAGCIGRPAKPF